MQKKFYYCALSKQEYLALMQFPEPEKAFKVFTVEARKYSHTSVVIHVSLGCPVDGAPGYVGYCLDEEHIKTNIQTYASALRFLVGQAILLEECGVLDGDITLN